MSRKSIRILLSVLIIGSAMTALLAMTLRDDVQYFKNVDEVMPQASAWYGKQLQMRGFVVEGSIQRRPDTMDRRFKVKNGDSVVLASYSGVVPDTFKDGAEVVLKGRLSSDGFHVDDNGVIMKCPSRYDPVTGK